MPIDQSVLHLVKSELDEGHKPEEIVSKLRSLEYTDDEIEEIFAKVGKSTGVTIIKAASRTTVFKTIFSPATLGIIFVLVLLVGGIYYLTSTAQVLSPEEKAKNMADATPDAQLFAKTMELQNAIVRCVTAFDTNNTGFGFCDVSTSKKLEDLGGGKYNVIYSADENSKCPKNYIKNNDMLEISVDLLSGSTSSKWNTQMFKEETVKSLYLKKDNCKYLEGYVADFVNKLKNL